MPPLVSDGVAVDHTAHSKKSSINCGEKTCGKPQTIVAEDGGSFDAARLGSNYKFDEAGVWQQKK